MLHAIKLAFGLGFLAIGFYVVYSLVDQYRQSTNTGYKRLWDAAYGSATKLWAKFVIVVAGVTANLDSLADFLGMPELKTAIDIYIGNPKIIAGVMLVISLVSIKARNRTA
jgi:hypothetical protein